MRMPVEPFRFKEFSVAHDRCAHKVGTDGVLLGAWAGFNSIRPFSPVPGTLKKPKKILDIGSGSGLIAMMLAQRFPLADITAIELDLPSFHQSLGNISNSDFADRITVLNRDFLTVTFEEKRFDLIVSNPPFFRDTYLSGRTERDKARHQLTLTLRSLVEKSTTILSPTGNLALILPASESQSVISVAMASGLQLKRKCRVYNKPGAECKRVMLEFGFRAAEGPFQKPIDQSLYIRDSAHNYHVDYKMLTAAFYLNF